MCWIFGTGTSDPVASRGKAARLPRLLEQAERLDQEASGTRVWPWVWTIFFKLELGFPAVLLGIKSGMSRSFAPGHGVPEDPVTGSMRATVTPF